MKEAVTVRDGTAADPITVEIIRGSLQSVIREIEILIERTAVSSMIREKGDHFAGIFDKSGQVIMSNAERHSPGKIDCILAEFGDDIHPGDIFWYNDPYLSRGAVSHSQDACLVKPVFVGGALFCFMTTFGHFTDIGGTYPGSISPRSTEIFQEGLLVPPVKIVEGGALQRSVYKIILRNTRLSEAMEGDTKALIAGVELGCQRIEEIVGKYGAATVEKVFEELLNRSDQAVCAFITSRLRDGVYHFDELIDSDGVSDQPYRVALRMEKQGERITVDFSDSDDQAAGSINYPVHPHNIGMILGNLLRIEDPHALLNEGTGRRIRVVLRPGSVVQPRFPAAVGMRSYTMFRIIGTLLGAVSQASDGRTPVESADYCLIYLRKLDRATGKYQIFMDGLGAGQGARPWADGLDVIYGSHQRNIPVEFIEQHYPYRIEQYAVNPDSGGPGLYRGGTGVVRDFRILSDRTIMATRMNNVRFQPWGARGGAFGRSGEIVINPDTTNEQIFNPLQDGIVLNEGDLVRVKTAGGGGWGDPFERDASAVQQDVRFGFVSRESARTHYGVVLTDDLQIDEEQTDWYRRHRKTDTPSFDRGPGYAAFRKDRQ